jgi:predicted dehydrogenase
MEMGFLKRIKRQHDTKPVLTCGIIGSGPLSDRLASAYRQCEDVRLTGICSIEDAEDIIRRDGIQAVEVTGPLTEQITIARECLRAGIFASIDPPAGLDTIEELHALAESHHTNVRFRLTALYYPPYSEVKRLVNEDHLARPICLKLVTKRGKGTEFPQELDPLKWIMENELGFLSLAQWLMGPIGKVYAKQLRKGGVAGPGSCLVMWKYSNHHQFGYLQLDFCPELHVRTFDDPVYRSIELTCQGGIIMATRGEGQLLRMPAVLVRGKSTATSFEMVPDDWSEVYVNLARETYRYLVNRHPIIGGHDAARNSARLADAAIRSHENGDEVKLI